MPAPAGSPGYQPLEHRQGGEADGVAAAPPAAGRRRPRPAAPPGRAAAATTGDRKVIVGAPGTSAAVAAAALTADEPGQVDDPVAVGAQDEVLGTGGADGLRDRGAVVRAARLGVLLPQPGERGPHLAPVTGLGVDQDHRADVGQRELARVDHLDHEHVVPGGQPAQRRPPRRTAARTARRARRSRTRPPGPPAGGGGRRAAAIASARPDAGPGHVRGGGLRTRARQRPDGSAPRRQRRRPGDPVADGGGPHPAGCPARR